YAADEGVTIACDLVVEGGVELQGSGTLSLDGQEFLGVDANGLTLTGPTGKGLVIESSDSLSLSAADVRIGLTDTSETAVAGALSVDTIGSTGTGDLSVDSQTELSLGTDTALTTVGRASGRLSLQGELSVIDGTGTITLGSATRDVDIGGTLNVERLSSAGDLVVQPLVGDLQLNGGADQSVFLGVSQTDRVAVYAPLHVGTLTTVETEDEMILTPGAGNNLLVTLDAGGEMRVRDDSSVSLLTVTETAMTAHVSLSATSLETSSISSSGDIDVALSHGYGFSVDLQGSDAVFGVTSNGSSLLTVSTESISDPSIVSTATSLSHSGSVALGTTAGGSSYHIDGSQDLDIYAANAKDLTLDAQSGNIYIGPTASDVHIGSAATASALYGSVQVEGSLSAGSNASVMFSDPITGLSGGSLVLGSALTTDSIDLYISAGGSAFLQCSYGDQVTIGGAADPVLVVDPSQATVSIDADTTVSGDLSVSGQVTADDLVVDSINIRDNVIVSSSPVVVNGVSFQSGTVYVDGGDLLLDGNSIEASAPISAPSVVASTYTAGTVEYSGTSVSDTAGTLSVYAASYLMYTSPGVSLPLAYASSASELVIAPSFPSVSLGGVEIENSGLTVGSTVGTTLTADGLTRATTISIDPGVTTPYVYTDTLRPHSSTGSTVTVDADDFTVTGTVGCDKVTVGGVTVSSSKVTGAAGFAVYCDELNVAGYEAIVYDNGKMVIGDTETVKITTLEAGSLSTSTILSTGGFTVGEITIEDGDITGTGDVGLFSGNSQYVSVNDVLFGTDRSVTALSLSLDDSLSVNGIVLGSRAISYAGSLGLQGLEITDNEISHSSAVVFDAPRVQYNNLEMVHLGLTTTLSTDAVETSSLTVGGASSLVFSSGSISSTGSISVSATSLDLEGVTLVGGTIDATSAVLASATVSGSLYVGTSSDTALDPSSVTTGSLRCGTASLQDENGDYVSVLRYDTGSSTVQLGQAARAVQILSLDGVVMDDLRVTGSTISSGSTYSLSLDAPSVIATGSVSVAGDVEIGTVSLADSGGSLGVASVSATLLDVGSLTLTASSISSASGGVTVEDVTVSGATLSAPSAIDVYPGLTVGDISLTAADSTLTATAVSTSSVSVGSLGLTPAGITGGALSIASTSLDLNGVSVLAGGVEAASVTLGSVALTSSGLSSGADFTVTADSFSLGSQTSSTEILRISADDASVVLGDSSTPVSLVGSSVAIESLTVSGGDVSTDVALTLAGLGGVEVNGLTIGSGDSLSFDGTSVAVSAASSTLSVSAGLEVVSLAVGLVEVASDSITCSSSLGIQDLSVSGTTVSGASVSLSAATVSIGDAVFSGLTGTSLSLSSSLDVTEVVVGALSLQYDALTTSGDLTLSVDGTLSVNGAVFDSGVVTASSLVTGGVSLTAAAGLVSPSLPVSAMSYVLDDGVSSEAGLYLETGAVVLGTSTADLEVRGANISLAGLTLVGTTLSAPSTLSVDCSLAVSNGLVADQVTIGSASLTEAGGTLTLDSSVVAMDHVVVGSLDLSGHTISSADSISVIEGIKVYDGASLSAADGGSVTFASPLVVSDVSFGNLSLSEFSISGDSLSVDAEAVRLSDGAGGYGSALVALGTELRVGTGWGSTYIGGISISSNTLSSTADIAVASPTSFSDVVTFDVNPTFPAPLSVPSLESTSVSVGSLYSSD
ncbi:hypothetical protein KIPB_008877, partial [Kipferlia bialata]